MTSMNDPCEQLKSILENSDFLTQQHDSYAAIDSLENVAPCIAVGLAEASIDKDWSKFERYTLAASRHPDRSYTAPLCEVLQQQLSVVNNDDIVTALGEIRDPDSAPVLVQTLWWQPDWDEFHQLALKCVWALGQIGTEESRAALRDAADVGPDAIRQEAATVLTRHN
ncbi:MAG TPA: HEAT repeat domain-containing protein [Actinophytocola sp.]|nr:HEAT repeat domain-containing protein [Actinophytocola sp.]